MLETIKSYLYNDCPKSDVKEIFFVHYPNATAEDFEVLYSQAFTSL